MVTRPTTTVPLTLDAKSTERATLTALMAKEKALTLESARRADGSDTPELAEIRAEMRALHDNINTGQITLTVTALSAGQYRNLLKNHAPRDGDDLEQRLGYNVDTFGRALLEACTLEAADHDGQPVPLDIPDWADDETGVGPGDFERWFRTALALQTRPVDQSPPLRAS